MNIILEDIAMDSFDEFINSEIYNNAIELLINKLGIEINHDYIHIKQREINLLSKANITVDIIKNIFENDFYKIIDFIILKMDKYKNEIAKGGDFPKGENIEKDDRPVTIKILPYYKSFMIRYIIEYYFLKMDQDKLLQYIKEIRIPQSKKYEKELIGIYKKIK
jgi:hypothetical protein